MTLTIVDRHMPRPVSKEREASAEDLWDKEAERYSSLKEGDPTNNRLQFRRKVETVRKSLNTSESLEATCRRLQSFLKESPDQSVQVQGPIAPSSLLELM